MALVECPECAREISNQAPSCPHCGVVIATPAAAPVVAEQASGPRWAAILGSLGIVGGSFLPWASVGGLISVDVAGTEGDGQITLIVGGVMVLIALATNIANPGGHRVLFAIGAIAAGAIAVIDIANVSRVAGEVSETGLATASVGVGLFVVLGGAVVAFFSVIVGRSAAK